MIGIPVIEVAGQQTAPGICDTKRTVHEHFQFYIRTLLANLPYLVERQFAGQDHPGQTDLPPEPHGRRVDGVCLHGKMDRHVRPAFPDQHDQSGVRHDQRIRPQRNDRGHIRKEGLELGPMGHQVAGDIEASSQGVGLTNTGSQILFPEIVIPHPKAVTWQPAYTASAP